MASCEYYEEQEPRTYEELLKMFREECAQISEQCEEEGYPSCGTNYELRVEGLWERYEQMYPQFFDEEDEEEEEE